MLREGETEIERRESDVAGKRENQVLQRGGVGGLTTTRYDTITKKRPKLKCNVEKRPAFGWDVNRNEYKE